MAIHRDRSIPGGTRQANLRRRATAALGVKQTAQLVNLIRSMAASGAGVVLVMYDLSTVRALANKIVVLSLRRVVHEGSAEHLDPDQLWGLMASGEAPS